MLTAILGSLGLKIALGGVAVFAPLLSKTVRQKAKDALSGLAGNAISKAIHIDAKDPFVNGRLSLAVRCLVDVAEKAMPDKVGEEKKAFVMGLLSKAPPFVQSLLSDMIDDAVTTMKEQAAKGNSDEIDKIISNAVDAVAKQEAVENQLPH